MKKPNLLIFFMAVIVLSFSAGCTVSGYLPPPGAAGMAVIGTDADIDFNAVYFDGSYYSYWALDPTGFWVLNRTAFLPPAYAYYGRTVYFGHYPEYWGHPGSRFEWHGGRGGFRGPTGNSVYRGNPGHYPSPGFHGSRGPVSVPRVRPTPRYQAPRPSGKSGGTRYQRK